MPQDLHRALPDLLQATEAALRRKDLSQAAAWSREAVHVARSQHAGDVALGTACLTAARVRYASFDYAESYGLALEASKLLGRSGKIRLEVQAMHICCVICIETGELVTAMDHARRALQQARAVGDHGSQAVLLHKQAVVFELMEEQEAAMRCLVEAVELFQRPPRRPADEFFARTHLAAACLAHAEKLSLQGDEAQAGAERERAVAVLPAVDYNADLAAISAWIVVKAKLGELESARRGALGYLKLIRRSGSTRHHLAHALLTLGEYHIHNGRPDKGVKRLQRAIGKLRLGSNRSQLALTEQRLTTVYAAAGQYAQALTWLRQARRDRSRMETEQNKLRGRMAALEREVERRRAEQQETLMHTQRLAVVGRLMADIYNALAGPITDVHHALETCAREVGNERNSPRLTATLGRVIQRVDEASGLARQLKMFSYRAAPQSMVVELNEALREAWQGVALWRRGAERRLVVCGDLRAQVRVDVQRLAVLLRILLIEADKVARTDAVSVCLTAGADTTRLQLVVEAPSGAAAEAGVGVTLCEEIAQEMGGRLCRAPLASGGVDFHLEFPSIAADAAVDW
ncbi:hypothetical protein [Caldimonas brevitalea]|uniref:Tetratricopeptide repeat protein n=1 Tax=Caldimonas brevitalea TaxID=413882 RepID=A0A0G3BEJ8_9BURK|nr:hypothetical protein [Caldimonas brevitalea]AKJ27819.1 hypothetical protein AAW51_1128 [Caldimonas brevitalea]